MKNLCLGCFLFLFIFNKGNAQHVFTLLGSVQDSLGNPLQGATIRLADSQLGTFTDAEGFFSLKTTSERGRLVFSFFGMKTQVVDYNGNSSFAIVMNEEVMDLEAVVVSAKQNINEIDVRAKTGNVEVVSIESLKNMPVASLALALQGKAQGVRIINRGELGVLPEIRIRGNSSLRKGDSANQPLFILDGKVISAETFYYLNTEDIKEVKILKDAVATALYGIKASNGVIEISSKRGGGAERLSYHMQMGAVCPSPLRIDLMDSSEKLELERRLRNIATPGYRYSKDYIDLMYAGTSQYLERLEEGRLKLDSLRQINTNWYKELTKVQLYQKHDVSYQNGTEKNSYLFSLGYLHQNGQIKGNGLKRISSYLALEQSFSNDAVMILSVSGSYAKNTTGNGSRFSVEELIYKLNPYETTQTKELISFPERGYLDLFNQFSGESTTKNIGTSLSLNWKLFSELELSAIVGLDYTLSEDLQITPETAYSEIRSGREVHALGTLTQAKGTLLNTTANIRLHYEKTFGKHELTIGGNADNYTTVTDLLSATGHGLYGKIKSVAAVDNSLEGAGKPQLMGIKQTDRNLGFGGLLGYTYNEAYNIFATYKLDASSVLAPKERWNGAWAIGMSVNLKKQTFFRNMDWLSGLNVRASYGQTANAQGISPALITATFKYRSQSYAGARIMDIQELPNENLKAEQNYITDLGFSVSAFKTTLNLSIYKRLTKDALLRIPIATSSGFSSQTQNIGILENKGIEIGIEIPLFETERWLLHWSGNLSYNQNKVLDLYNRERIYISSDEKIPSYQIGKSVEALYGLHSVGINPITGLPDFITADGRQVGPSTNFSGEDYLYLGLSTPPISGGFSFSVNYQQWRLFTDFYYTIGGKGHYTNSYIRDESTARFNAAKVQLTDMWWELGDQNKRYHTPFYQSGALENLQKPNTKNVVTTDFIRFSRLAMYYQFGNEQLATLWNKISHASVGLVVANVALWSAYKDSDPETRNIVNPLPPTFTLNFNIAF